MLFYVLAERCETFAVAIIRAENLQHAVDIALNKFRVRPDRVEVTGVEAILEYTSGFFPENGDYRQIMNIGDVKGDLASRFNIKPLPAGDYVKIGCFVD